VKRCCICDNKDPKKFENVDHFRMDDDQKYTERVDGKKVTRPMNMTMCLDCGFVSYPDRLKSEDELKKYYKSNYRNSRPPDFNNLVTGQRKLFYHEHFLKDLFSKWKKTNRKDEVGAAMGMALNMYKQIFPKATIRGTEWTSSYRRVAYHEYGIELDEDFDSSVKYDLIMSYKVAEHQVDPDIKIREYATSLKPDGVLYISVPTWFNELNNSGSNNFDLPYYYHPDHINVWSQYTFELLLKKCGLEIIKQDHKMYGDTYLCKRNDELMKEELELETSDQIKKAMDHVKKSYQAFLDKKPEEALALWANCPLYWGTYYELNREKLHTNNFDDLYEKVVEPFLEKNERRVGSLVFAADLCMRYEHFERAAEILNELLEFIPNNGRALQMLGHCMRNLASKELDVKRRMEMLKSAHSITSHLAKVDLQTVQDAVNWKYRDASEIPIPSELKTAMISKNETNKTMEDAIGKN